MEGQQDLFNNTVSDRLQRWVKPFDGLRPGKYIFETTPESKGDYIKREIEIVEHNGELGVFLRMTGVMTKLKDFRSDCSLTLIEEA